MTGRATTSRGGFSIVEATLAVILVGGAMVAAINVATAASRTSASATQRRQAEALAHALMAEILIVPATGADSTNATGGARLNNFDHILDYQGLSESPPATLDGTPCAPAGWTRSVSVSARGSDTIDARSMDLRMYLVTVTVAMPDGTTVSTSALRGDTSTVDRVPVADTAAVVQLPITITLPDGTVLRAAPQPLGTRQPDGAQRSATLN